MLPDGEGCRWGASKAIKRPDLGQLAWMVTMRDSAICARVVFYVVGIKLDARRSR
jgi:hypothetical protein